MVNVSGRVMDFTTDAGIAMVIVQKVGTIIIAIVIAIIDIEVNFAHIFGARFSDDRPGDRRYKVTVRVAVAAANAEFVQEPRSGINFRRVG